VILVENNELQHHGILGMKWGVRRTPEQLARSRDNKTRKTLTRHLAADKKHLKEQGRMMNEAQDKYNTASSNYKKALSRPSFSRAKKEAAVKEASEKLSRAGDEYASRKANLNRAERIYKVDEQKLKNHVDKMIKDYGGENVKALSTKTYSIGEHWTRDMIKTGVTVADLPVIGTMYSGRYIGDREYEDRMKNIDKSADKRY
jgi:hypothetical protein